MSIRKKILLLFALLVSLSGAVAWRGYEAYIAIIKQHEVVDLKDETTNAATRLTQSLSEMQVQASALGGETAIRTYLSAGDAATPDQRAAAVQRLGRLIQTPVEQFVRVRLLDRSGAPLACVVRQAWQAPRANETTDRRAARIAKETSDSIQFEECPAATGMPVGERTTARPEGVEAFVTHERAAPVMNMVAPIRDAGERLGYVEIAKDLRAAVLDEMTSPRVVTLLTDAQGKLVLDASDASGRTPSVDAPVSEFIPELRPCYAKQDPAYDFRTVQEFAPPRDAATAALAERFKHHFLVARYPDAQMSGRYLDQRRETGERIERALLGWRGDDPNRRFFNTSETLERDSRIVVCAATSGELEGAARALAKASGGEVQIDKPRATKKFAVQFQKVFWTPGDRAHYFGLVRAASVEEIEADVCSELWRLTWLWLVAVPLALAVIVLWGPGFIAQPLTEMTEGAGKIAKGELQKVEVPRSRDEIERMGVALNAMVAALSEREELQAANDQLAKAKRDLERAQASREEFLASVSHELRTPLTTVLGFCRQLLKSQLTDRQRGDVERIQFAGDRLLRLVKDILDYQKVVMGRLPLEPRDFDLTQLVANVVEENQPRAAERELALRLESDGGALPIHADDGRVTQVLENLIGNALKFTRHGEIVCRVRRETRGDVDWAVVEVQDTGRGMTADQQEQLFRPFCKFLDNAENPTGTGLGLAICRGICRASGGDVRVDPERTVVGVGSTFVVELPMSPVKFSTTWSAPPLRPHAGEAIVEASLVSQTGSVALVIDDDADIAELLKQFFHEQGFDVAVASSGIAGLAEAKRLRPGLITLDVQMPDLDGWQVLRLLKSEPATADIPVVLVTIADDKQRGFALGATDYLSKPIDWNRLTSIVDRVHHNGTTGKVLVVEDDPGQRELLARGLKGRGCEVVEAANGKRALEALEDFVPDLILLDLIMPEMDGFQFLAALRDHSELRDATVVVVSGKELDEADYERLRGQVTEVIEKGEASWEEIQRELARLMKLYVGDGVAAGGTTG